MRASRATDTMLSTNNFMIHRGHSLDLARLVVDDQQGGVVAGEQVVGEGVSDRFARHVGPLEKRGAGGRQTGVARQPSRLAA